MAKVNRLAWSILSPDEKTALGLQHGMNKSSWESGEIMDKSHYKYLEIKYRAEKFLAMFTEHLEIYLELIPPYISGELTVKKYFQWCIGERLKPMVALGRLNDNDQDRVYTKSSMNAKIIDQVKAWGRSENPYELSVFNLIKEFDRWNNYRILPREVQEPSAFKRRVKNMYKKHIRALTSMPALSREKLLQLSLANKAPCAYMPLLKPGGWEVVKVKINRLITPLYTDLCLYTFKTEEEAKTYIANVFSYVNNQDKDCKDGITFWQIYRECIQTALNYNDVQRITATRSHLEMALKNLSYL